MLYWNQSTSLDDYYSSFEKIEKLKAYVLPGHDPRVLERKSFP